MTQGQRITSRAALLAAWLVVAVASTWAIDLHLDTAVASTLLLGLTAALTLIRPFRGSHLIVTFVGGIALGAVHGIRISGPGVVLEPIDFVPGLTAVLGIIFTAYFASIVHRALTTVAVEDSRTQASYLQRVGPGSAGITSASRHEYMRRLIAGEVDRARRYEHSFSILVLEPDQWREYAQRMVPTQLARISAELEHHLLARLRTTDTLIQLDDARFIALLPETGMDGAHVAARKLAIAGESVLGAEVRTGLAAFPEDGITADQLLGEAEAALAFAQSAGIALASRALLR
ncbi:MAG: diguanylate cyclase [Dehalococcoidia bacterium]